MYLLNKILRMRLFYLISFVLAQDGIDYWDDSPGFLKRSHSLISPFSGNLPLWELKGDSMATSEYIRLTPDQQSKNGAIWSRVVSLIFVEAGFLDEIMILACIFSLVGNPTQFQSPWEWQKCRC